MRVCFASGKISRAMQIFHHLNYGPNGTHISRSSYIQIIEYMGDTRGSVVGAEHSFDAWFQTMLYSELLTQALIDKWREIGMTKEAQTTPNAFLPRNRSLSEVMQKLQAPSSGYNGPYKSRAIHKWELHMVMALVHAYVKAGMYEKARLWEVWIFDSIRSKDLKLRPEKAACMEPVQRCHLQRGSQEGVQACLEYIVAIHTNVSDGMMVSKVYFLNQRHILLELVKCIRGDKSGRLAPMVRSYLETHKAGDLNSVMDQLSERELSSWVVPSKFRPYVWLSRRNSIRTFPYSDVCIR
ncbi:hypothetical protein GGI22_006143 [Coemansia erecta]|nr:hypothetical protein GGI22_006143 [Coemansia erecta]